LFYQALVRYTEDLLPFLYTPTVGEACIRYHQLPIPTYGVYLRSTEIDNFASILHNLPTSRYRGVQIVVVTDGERILGLGDLGTGGMGIVEGKSLLYTAAAGVFPSSILPVCLDVGTSNAALLRDPNYPGLPRPRSTGKEYETVIERFVSALLSWRPNVVLQFEDFANHNAFRLLDRYKSRLACFNDDVQGTACVAVAALLSALRVTGSTLAQQKILFLGAGEAGTGIGELIALALQLEHNMSRVQGRKICFFMDSKGLVCSARLGTLQPHKRPFAHYISSSTEIPTSLAEAIELIRPSVLIGVSTSPGAFTPSIIRQMAAINDRPIIFPLSNPTDKSECTFEEAFRESRGRVLFASGSPFPPMNTTSGKLYPSQANNAYVFPAIGYAASLCRSKAIPEETFYLTAKALSRMIPPHEVDSTGSLFPPFSSIRSVSTILMAAIAHDLCNKGIGMVPDNFDVVVHSVLNLKKKTNTSSLEKWATYIKAHMFDPSTSPRL
jgi:malate dehydrogenase (oxaloacetate-decarboxylating)(NADP+)